MGTIKYIQWKENMNLYGAKRLSEELGFKVATVRTRFRSKYANKLWGVGLYRMPSGKFRRYVPEEKLYLWKGNSNHRGRPVEKLDLGQDSDL
jgi:hypothetical protein